MKSVPVTVTVVPTGPEAGLKLVIAGAVAVTPWQPVVVPQLRPECVGLARTREVGVWQVPHAVGRGGFATLAPWQVPQPMPV